MMMPSGAASLFPNHDDDSVENEIDFGPPPAKKLKCEEEDNSSVPISEDSYREAFKRWCKLYGKEYTDESETEKRFKCFKDSFNREVNPVFLQCGMNATHYADLDEQEFNDLFCFAIPVIVL